MDGRLHSDALVMLSLMSAQLDSKNQCLSGIIVSLKSHNVDVLTRARCVLMCKAVTASAHRAQSSSAGCCRISTSRHLKQVFYFFFYFIF